MKNYVFVLVILLSSCSKPSSSTSEKVNVVDDVSEAELREAERIADSAVAAIDDAAIEHSFSAADLKDAPVQVINYGLVKKEYSNYRDIELSYKNISDKTIEGIRFEWFGKNAFDEPADMGNSLVEGAGRGFTDEVLKPGQTGSGTWEILSRDAKKIVSVRPYEVVFSDGSKWKLK